MNALMPNPPMSGAPSGQSVFNTALSLGMQHGSLENLAANPGFPQAFLHLFPSLYGAAQPPAQTPATPPPVHNMLMGGPSIWDRLDGMSGVNPPVAGQQFQYSPGWLAHAGQQPPAGQAPQQQNLWSALMQRFNMGGGDPSFHHIIAGQPNHLWGHFPHWGGTQYTDPSQGQIVTGG